MIIIELIVSSLYSIYAHMHSIRNERENDLSVEFCSYRTNYYIRPFSAKKSSPCIACTGSG